MARRGSPASTSSPSRASVVTADASGLRSSCPSTPGRSRLATVVTRSPSRGSADCRGRRGGSCCKASSGWCRGWRQRGWCSTGSLRAPPRRACSRARGSIGRCPRAPANPGRSGRCRPACRPWTSAGELRRSSPSSRGCTRIRSRCAARARCPATSIRRESPSLLRWNRRAPCPSACRPDRGRSATGAGRRRPAPRAAAPWPSWRWAGRTGPRGTGPLRPSCEGRGSCSWWCGRRPECPAPRRRGGTCAPGARAAASPAASAPSLRSRRGTACRPPQPRTGRPCRPWPRRWTHPARSRTTRLRATARSARRSWRRRTDHAAGHCARAHNAPRVLCPYRSARSPAPSYPARARPDRCGSALPGSRATDRPVR